MANYDGRKKVIKDNDLIYFNNTDWGTSAASTISDTIDLGAAQTFGEHVPLLYFTVDRDFSFPSSVGGVSGQAACPGLIVQDSADGSTWAGTYLEVPFFTDGKGRSGASTVTADNVNAHFPVGLGSPKRYTRLLLNYATGTASTTIRAWLRMGLSA
jgi:hypothetical protein